MIVRRLGRVAYAPTWAAMRDFTLGRDDATPDELWLAEHPPVFTQGIAGKASHLLAPGDIPVVATDRGGQVTFHGPGQVVAYPLVDLRRLGIYVKEYVWRLEEALRQTLDGVGVVGNRVNGAPGLYVRLDAPHLAVGSGPRPDAFAGLAKIAAIGIKITQHRAYHGVSLNVAMPELAAFLRINPCGYAGLVTTDLATLGVHVAPEDVAHTLAERLSAHLS